MFLAELFLFFAILYAQHKGELVVKLHTILNTNKSIPIFFYMYSIIAVSTV